MPDGRQRSSYILIAPYLANFKKYERTDAIKTLKDWLEKNNRKVPLGKNVKSPEYYIGYAIKKGILPPSRVKLAGDHSDLEEILFKANIFDKKLEVENTKCRICGEHFYFRKGNNIDRLCPMCIKSESGGGYVN